MKTTIAENPARKFREAFLSAQAGARSAEHKAQAAEEMSRQAKGKLKQARKWAKVSKKLAKRARKALMVAQLALRKAGAKLQKAEKKSQKKMKKVKGKGLHRKSPPAKAPVKKVAARKSTPKPPAATPMKIEREISSAKKIAPPSAQSGDGAPDSAVSATPD